MDTTLPLYIGLLGDEYVITAVFSGVTLTAVIPIILPLMLNLP
ncbi:LysO family transporter [Sulfuracidifex metallicus]|nr:LysO family transporter [Sulfuracidifex metallicus]